MTQKTKFFLTIVLLFCAQFAKTQETTPTDCSIVHKGVFIYDGFTKDEIKIVIKGATHTEYHSRGKYIIKSSLKWVNDCEYETTLLKVTIPNFAHKPGAVMNVKIVKIVGTKIFFTSTVDGESWNGALVKLK